MGKEITQQEAKLNPEQKQHVEVGDLLKTLIEMIAVEARQSEFVDSKSGVSARLTISAYENLVSTAERRMLLNGEDSTFARISDLAGVVSAINGKIELVYEGEQEGAAMVSQGLIGKAIRNYFTTLFPDPGKLKKKKQVSPYQKVLDWFSENDEIDILLCDSDKAYKQTLDTIPALEELLALVNGPDKPLGNETYVMKEFILHALAEHSQLGKAYLERGIQFKDLFGSVFSAKDLGEEESS
jgi:magnesium chelatase subunit I